MTRPDDIDTATLRDLLAKASPRPWEQIWESVAWVDTIADPNDISGQTPMQDPVKVADAGPDDRALIVAAINALPALLDVVDNATTQKQRADHLSAKVSRVEALADLWFETGGPSPRWQNDLRRALGGEQHQEGQ